MMQLVRKTTRNLIVLLMMSICFACYENQEGCLDINASNFNVMADIACEACCELPELRLSVQHNISDSVIDTLYRFNLNQLYGVDRMDSFQLSEVRFLLSDIQLRRDDGELVGVANTRDFVFLNSRDTVVQRLDDNFVAISRQNISTRTIGITNAPGTYEGIQFRLGLPETIDGTLPSVLPDNHPLADTIWYDEESRQFDVLQLTLVRPMLADTLIIGLTAEELRETIVLDLPFDTRVGFDIVLSIRVDYRTWWRGININGATVEQIKTKLIENIPTSFELVEVR